MTQYKDDIINWSSEADYWNYNEITQSWYYEIDAAKDHFWDAYTNTPLSPIFKTAYDKASFYWNLAVGNYLEGDYKNAYGYIGVVAHFLSDMGSPAHVHNDEHFFSSPDYLEQYLTETEIKNYGKPADNLISKIPPYNSLYDLFYNLNIRTAYFPSNSKDGKPQNLSENHKGWPWLENVYWPLIDRENLNNNQILDDISKIVIPLTIHYVARLYQLFSIQAQDGGGDFSSSKVVSVGSVTGGFLDVAGDKDYFKFTIPSTGTYVLLSRGDLPLCATVYDAAYQSVTSDCNSGELENFRIVRALNPGTYYVEVRADYPYTGTGAYALHLEGPGAGTVSDDHGSSAWSATPVSLGSVTSGNLSLAGDLDFFRFTAPAAGTYVLYSLGDLPLCATVYDAAYQSVTSDCNSGELENFRIVRALNPGTYYVEVRADYPYTGTGAYALHLEGPGAGTVSDDHGSSAWSATPVSLGSVTSGNLSLAGDLDFFRFTAPAAGTYVLYSLGDLPLCATVYDAAYQSVTSDCNSGELENFRIVRALNPGTYYVEVRADYPYTGTGAYALHLEGPGAGTVSDDHGSSAWSATPVSLGSVTSGNLSLAGDLDFFRFTAPAAGTYVLYSLGDLPLCATVYDAAYQSVTSDCNSGELENFRIVRALNPGTYYVEVRADYPYTGTGAYALHLEGPGAGTVSDDHGSSAWSATPVSLGSVTSGNLSLAGDLDFFRFTAPAAGTYVLYSLGDLPLCATVYDAAYQSVTSDCNSGELENFRIVRALNPGTYYVEVRADYPYTGTGAYALHLEGPPSDGTPPTPNPLSFSILPYAISSTSLGMAASAATDSGTPPVSYFFDFVDSPTSGTGSGFCLAKPGCFYQLRPSTQPPIRLPGKSSRLGIRSQRDGLFCHGL